MRSPVLNIRSARSRKEYLAYLDDVLARSKVGELTLDEYGRWNFGAETSQWHHHSINQDAILEAIEKNLLREKDYIMGWPERNPGQGIP